MAYTRFLFTANDTWGKLAYSFDLNMVLRELSVRFDNMRGGYIVSGICLTDDEYNTLLGLTNKKRFDKYTDLSSMNTVSFPLDPYSWELSLFYDDGSSMETIYGNDKLITYEVPASIYDFVKKVMEIGGMNTEKQRLF